MERRALLAGAAALLVAPLAAEGQQAGKVPLIGLLGTATASLMSSWLTAFREGLRERGYVPGQNIATSIAGARASQSGFLALRLS
jgi:putative tryptophan/tyrosine transport system substrate-binding protein